MSTVPADGLPQLAIRLDTTCPASVVTAEPAAFWNGSGMSTFCSFGHKTTVPTITAMPITPSNPTTTLAANGLTGPGSSGSVWECACE
jgi:hypothetical protein